MVYANVGEFGVLVPLSCWERKGAPYTTMKTAIKIDENPAHVSHPIEWNLRTLAQPATTIVAIKDHQTVQVACVESALRPVETPRMPEPVQRT